MLETLEMSEQVLESVAASRQHPFERLGMKVESTWSIEEALANTGSNDNVYPVTLYDHDVPEGEEPEDAEGIIAIKSDKYGRMGYTGPGYAITQRRDIVDLALDITGVSKDEARIATMANVGKNHEKFIVHMVLPELVIDPNGIADKIERGLYVATSFDGSLPNLIGYSNVRWFCMNQINTVLRRGLSQAIKVKHTRNAEDRLKVAAAAMGYAGAVESELIKKAEQMLSVKDGDKALTGLLDHFWPIHDADLGDKAKSRRMRERGDVRMLYEGTGNTNVDVAGRNGWSAYNALVEYMDFAQPVKGVRGNDVPKRRAERAVLPGATVDAKVKASSIVLSMN